MISTRAHCSSQTSSSTTDAKTGGTELPTNSLSINATGRCTSKLCELARRSSLPWLWIKNLETPANDRPNTPSYDRIMATKKQRRRRQKLQRHEYEYIIETEEGEEHTVDRLSEEGSEREKARKQPERRGGRKIEPPSLQRVAKRTAIFGPLIVVLVFITSGNMTMSAKLFNALVLVAFFVPFSYVVDVIVYRFFRRRQGGAKQSGGRSTPEQ